MSGKVRNSIIAAFAAVTVTLSNSQPAQASKADAFTTPNQQHKNRPQKQGFFSPKPNNGSEPEKPNDDGSGGGDGDIPTYPKTESIKETQNHLSIIDQEMNKLEELSDAESETSDSDSETEENQCQIKSPGKFEFDSEFDYELDENDNPIVIVSMKDGSIRRIEFDQTRNKWYHANLFRDIKAPDGFDNQAVRNMDYSKKLDYLKENIPDESVFELQKKIAKSLTHPEIISVPGFLGKQKIRGMLDINRKSGFVSFTDAVTNKHRTIVEMGRNDILELVKNDFHLFPNT